MAAERNVDGIGRSGEFSVVSVEPMADKKVYPPGTDGQPVVRLTFKSAVDGKTDWALFRPGKPGRNTVVFMHGAFSHGDQIYTRQDIRRFWLERIIDKEHPLLSVNLRDTTYMSPATSVDLTDLLDHCARQYACSNYVLLGGSGGASSAMAYAVLHPEKLHGVVAMGMCDIFARLDFARKSSNPLLRSLAHVTFSSYGGTLEEKPELYNARSVLRHADRLVMPVVLTMGEKDALIPVAETRKIAMAMRDKKNFTYVEIPRGGHDSALWVDVDLQTLKVLNANAARPHLEGPLGGELDVRVAAYLRDDDNAGGVFCAARTPAKDIAGPVNAGVRFMAEADGRIIALKFFQAKDESGEHVFTIWEGKSKSLSFTAPASPGPRMEDLHVAGAFPAQGQNPLHDLAVPGESLRGHGGQPLASQEGWPGGPGRSARQEAGRHAHRDRRQRQLFHRRGFVAQHS